MNKISTLNSSNNTSVMVFKDENDDGLVIEWNHGRMQWYRPDTGYFVNIDNYSFWKPN